jgi:hypothetical protein
MLICGRSSHVSAGSRQAEPLDSPYEWIPPQEAWERLRTDQAETLRRIGRLQTFPEVQEFLRSINSSISGPPYDPYQTLDSARTLAGAMLRRLEKEQAGLDSESDAHKFRRTLEDYDPFMIGVRAQSP